MPDRHHLPWSEEDEKRLSWDWGTIPLTKLAVQFKRTPMAVWRKADAMGLGRANRGGMSLTEFARYSGFSPEKIKKSARALGINLHRGLASEPGAKRDRVRDFVINDDQHEPLIEFMMKFPFVFANEGPDARMTRAGVWGIGKKPPQCLRCGRSDKPHYCKGYCKSCYNKVKTRGKYKPSGNPVQRYFDKPILSDEQVEAIRWERYREHTSQTKLAKKYGVSNTSIWRIIRGIDRKRAGGPIEPYTHDNVHRTGTK